MYAIVEIAGQQFKVAKDQQIFVHRLEGKEGDKLTFDRVLLTEDGDKVTVGAPVIKGTLVKATILEHLKGDKVIVFKKKRRKGYQVKNGHRQYLTSLKIESIGKEAVKKAAAPKKEEAPKKEAAPKAEASTKAAAPKKVAASASAKATGDTRKKETTAKAVAPKKAAPKKAAPKKDVAKAEKK